MSQFVLIDGNNLYIRSRQQPDERVNDGRHRRYPYPCLEAVESVVNHCVQHGIRFKLYFDFTSRYNFDWWAQKAGDAGRELLRRYEALCSLGDEHVLVASPGTEADMFMLAEAEALRRRGLKPFIVTQDRFEDRLQVFPDLLVSNDKVGRPDCCLMFSDSKILGERALVFARLPMKDGHLHEVRIPIKGYPDIAERVKAFKKTPPAPARSDPKRKEPAQEDARKAAAAPTSCPKDLSPTLLVEKIANITVPGLRLYGNGQVYSLGLRRSALLEAGQEAWPVTVGRADDQDLVVHESFPAVSRRQLVFDRDADLGCITVTDSGSSNGTWLNGQKLAAGVPTSLPGGPGLITMVGSGEPVSFAVHLFYENAVADKTDESRVADKVDGSNLEAGTPVLHVRLASGRQLHYEIRSLPFTVGTSVTGAGASLDLPEALSVSREHLQIVSATGDEGFLVRPMGRNGTSVRGAPQTSPFLLPFGGEIVLSPKDTQTGNVTIWITRS